MNRQAYSVVFCVLLASGFVHEIRAKAALTPELARLERSADTKFTCKESCNENSPRPTLKILANAKANTIAVINETIADCAVGIVIDVQEKQCLVVDERSKQAVLIDVSDDEAKCIKIGQLARETTIEDLLVEFKSCLSPLVKSEDKTGKDVQDLINKVLVRLISQLQIEVQNRPEEGLKVLNVISSRLVDLLEGPLEGYLEVVEDEESKEVKKDLVGILNILEGYAVVVDCIPGGVSGLIEAGSCSLGSDETTTGSERIAEAIRVLGRKSGIPEELARILNDFESEQALLALLGGMENSLVNGEAKLVTAIVAYLNGQISLEITVQIMIQFLTESGKECNENKNLIAETNSNITAILKAVEDVKANQQLCELVSGAKSYQNESLIIKNVNIPAVVNTAINGLNDPETPLLQVLIKVIQALSPCVKIEEASLTILGVLLLDLASPLGVELIKDLGIDVPNTNSPTRNLLASTLSTVPDLKKSLKEKDLYSVLSCIPVIDNILKALSEALSCATSENINLESLVNSNPEFKCKVIAYFQLVTCQDLGAEEAALDKIKSFSQITDIEFLLGIAVSVNVTSTGLDVYLG